MSIRDTHKSRQARARRPALRPGPALQRGLVAIGGLGLLAASVLAVDTPEWGLAALAAAALCLALAARFD